MALTIYVNNGASDVPLNFSGSTWTEIDTINDTLIFSNGSDVVADGLAIPSDSQLNSAAPILTGLEQTVSKYFLADNSANILREIFNMGSGNKRYVMAFDFDAATVSEPVLEVWDDTNLNTIAGTVLGAGVPTSSWYRGITTTDGLPGVGWTGYRLAGSSDTHFLWLNNENGPLLVASTLYCQLKIVIPSSQTTGGTAIPVFAIKYSSL